MKVTERQKEILNKIVREYINLARPISSQSLEKKYDFGVCPATIRIEMQKLTEKGYLYQPHTSAGRLPTDKGYRFFVDNLLEENGDESKASSSLSAFEDIGIEQEFEELITNWFFEDRIRFIQLLTKNLALNSTALVLSYLEKEKIFWKEGWEEILKEPEFREEDCIINFVKLLESFEKNIEDLNISSGIKIYIGRENPFKRIKDFSIIFSKCCLPNEDGTIILLFGPKRMAYDRNIGLINSLSKVIREITDS